MNGQCEIGLKSRDNNITYNNQYTIRNIKHNYYERHWINDGKVARREKACSCDYDLSEILISTCWWFFKNINNDKIGN